MARLFLKMGYADEDGCPMAHGGHEGGEMMPFQHPKNVRKIPVSPFFSGRNFVASMAEESGAKPPSL
jgi:hypothetical protein